MRYLSAEQVLFIHSRLIDETGGSHGIRDVGLLQSSVGRSKATYDGKDLYPDIFHKVAALMESLIKNHPFVDGNKRTAITSAGVLLQMNGFIIETSQKDIERFTLGMAHGKIPVKDAAEWFKHNSLKINR